MDRNSAITAIKGIGAKTKEVFEKTGVYTVGDILLRFPRTYIQYPAARSFPMTEPPAEGTFCALRAAVSRTPATRQGRMPVTVLNIGGTIDAVQLIWYRMPYIRSSLEVGKQYVFYGKIIKKGGRLVMEQPAVYKPEQYEAIELCFLPVYPLSAGLTNNLMIKTMRQALADDELFSDYLPAGVRREHALCEYNYAMKQIHFPDSMDTLITARRRLVFDEFFLFIMGLQYQKAKQQRPKNPFPAARDGFAERLAQKLPYELTGAQQAALEDILQDMSGPSAMQRLIQGDVGSGKTILAFLAMAVVSHNGFQSAIMAPTEVLARQHYETYCGLCGKFGLDVAIILLTGSMTQKQKKDAYARILSHPDAMVIGTHALIQEKTVFSNLALVITDEQHRFGVKQRDAFSEKGAAPHILVMSATPIPRTLAIILYGDLDISVVNEVPAKRLPVKNCVVNTGYREKAYAFLKKQADLGHQAYVICPLVEASEAAEAENVTDYAKRLNEVFGGSVSVGLLHGRMKSGEKNGIMERFARNRIQVLVSTTVVEVGVNVPNATVMMIENADRFGLAQLHQLRGRVGRGEAQSYCIMINTSDSKTAQERLEILNRSNDGFYIASEDLKMRGPGDFFGIRQSGDLAFSLADVYQDAGVLQEAAEEVKRILSEDPELAQEEHASLRAEMERFMENRLQKMSL